MTVCGLCRRIVGEVKKKDEEMQWLGPPAFTSHGVSDVIGLCVAWWPLLSPDRQIYTFITRGFGLSL